MPVAGLPGGPDINGPGAKNRGRGGSARQRQRRHGGRGVTTEERRRYGTSSTTGPGGSGGGGGTGAVTNVDGQVSYTPPNFQATAQRDPQLDAMYERYGEQDQRYKQQDQAYQSQINGLAAGNDRDAINAMQRQRDLLSGLQGEGAENSARRGLGPNTGAAQQTQNDMRERGLQSMSGLNAGLASDARRQQLAALGGQSALLGGQSAGLGQQTGAAQASAAAMLGQQQQGLDQWRTQQQANLGAAQLAALQNQNQWQNQLGLFQAMTPFYQGYPGMSTLAGNNTSGSGGLGSNTRYGTAGQYGGYT